MKKANVNGRRLEDQDSQLGDPACTVSVEALKGGARARTWAIGSQLARGQVVPLTIKLCDCP